MAITLDQARANNSQSPKIAGDGAVMVKAYGDDYRFVCRVSDAGRQIIAFAHRQFPGRRVPPGDGVTGWTISGLAVPGAIVAVRISGIEAGSDFCRDRTRDEAGAPPYLCITRLPPVAGHPSRRAGLSAAFSMRQQGSC